MNGYYKTVAKILAEHGYQLIRSKGSHEMWSNGKRMQTLSKNMPSRDMANVVLKQAGIKHRF